MTKYKCVIDFFEGGEPLFGDKIFEAGEVYNGGDVGSKTDDGIPILYYSGADRLIPAFLTDKQIKRHFIVLEDEPPLVDDPYSGKDDSYTMISPPKPSLAKGCAIAVLLTLLGLFTIIKLWNS